MALYQEFKAQKPDFVLCKNKWYIIMSLPLCHTVSGPQGAKKSASVKAAPPDANYSSPGHKSWCVSKKHDQWQMSKRDKKQIFSYLIISNASPFTLSPKLLLKIVS